MRGEIEHVITQFADDTTLFLEFSEECICETVKALTYVENNTGLKISYEKTNVYCIGSLKNSKAQIYTTKDFSWSDGDIEMLGVTVINGPHQSNESFDNAIVKMRNVANVWHNRFLTLMGKILLINSLMASLFIYKMAVLPKMSTKQLKEIDQIILHFLWEDKKPKIPIKVLRNTKSKGGLKLASFEYRHDAMHLTWIPKTLEKEFNYIFECLCPLLRETIWECNLMNKDAQRIIKCKCFWGEVLCTWSKWHFYEPQTYEDIVNQVIWYNSKIRIGNRACPLNSKLFKKGIVRIKDLLNSDNILCTLEELINLYGKDVQSEWLTIGQIYGAFPTLWARTIASSQTLTGETSRLSCKDLILTKKPSAYVYAQLLERNEFDISYYGVKIFRMLQKEYCEEKYLTLFRNLYIISKDTKLRNFQYRLLLGKIFPNNVLAKWKIVTDASCEWCGKLQDIAHLFWECTHVQKIWSYIKNSMEASPEYEWNLENIICNTIHARPSHGINQLVLICKFFIFQCKCSNQMLKIQGMLKVVKDHYLIQLYNAKITESVNKLLDKWKPVLPCIAPTPFGTGTLPS